MSGKNMNIYSKKNMNIYGKNMNIYGTNMNIYSKNMNISRKNTNICILSFVQTWLYRSFKSSFLLGRLGFFIKTECQINFVEQEERPAF